MSQEAIQDKLTDLKAKLASLTKAEALSVGYALTIARKSIRDAKKEINRLEQLIK